MALSGADCFRNAASVKAGNKTQQTITLQLQETENTKGALR